jgi:DNA-directed RNA polymerase delta subunit
MTTSVKTDTARPFDYQKTTEAILKQLRRDRDRQVIARRFGFDLAKRQTLEQIGQDFGITRERVRQIEKATIAKIKASQPKEVEFANRLISEYLEAEGGICTTAALAAKLGATTPSKQPYVIFLATLSPDIEVVDENDDLRPVVILNSRFSPKSLRQLAAELVDIIAKHGKPLTLDQLDKKLSQPLAPVTLANLASVSNKLASHEGRWGLIEWPEVNPKSIRDKTYLVMAKHKQPLHFSEIADRIRNSNFNRRNVTVQAVHNELIKDSRFILIGRGIYALAEWGYSPGTVADIITEILKQESPLHKDEIVKRVLEKRQVKTTTIVLNLQEKDQFSRVAKATYKLNDQ